MRRPLLLAICLAVFTAPAFSQAETMVTGKILDSAGRNLTGYEVRVCDCAKQDSTDKEGIYKLYLPAGSYELQVFRGQSLIRRRFVDIPPDDFFEVDFRL